jgi:hypothetical protein
MTETSWDWLEVDSVRWGGESIDRPMAADLDRALSETGVGQTLAIYLEDDGLPTPPQLILGREDGGWSVTFKSESDELWPAEDLYDADAAARIARLFFDEKRLDPADGWAQP